MAECRGARPDRTERAQARGVPEMKRIQILADRLGALEMQDRGDASGGDRGADVGRAAADGKRSGPLHPHQVTDHRGGHRLRRGQRHHRRQGEVIGRVLHRLVHRGGGWAARRRDKNGEEAADEMSRLHARKVEMALALAFKPDGPAPRRVAKKPQQEVVMPVENGNALRHLNPPRRCRANPRRLSGGLQGPCASTAGRVKLTGKRSEVTSC